MDMERLALEGSDSPVQAQVGDGSDRITPEQRAGWLIEYITLHQGEDRNQLLRRAVAQITAAEDKAYERGWLDGISTADVNR
jgi:hypothetical protein